MLTTAQLDIAEDFDAFSETTWFSSAYLVRLFNVILSCPSHASGLIGALHKDRNVQCLSFSRTSLSDLHSP